MKRRTHKRRDHPITPEAVIAFQRAEATAERYYACAAGNCISTELGRHCDICSAFLDACRDLHRLLQLRPWQTSPIHAAGERPAWQNAEEWKLAAELRAELEAASCR